MLFDFEMHFQICPQQPASFYNNAVTCNTRVQIEEVCSMLGADPLLAGGYHGIGISQVR